MNAVLLHRTIVEVFAEIGNAPHGTDLREHARQVWDKYVTVSTKTFGYFLLREWTALEYQDAAIEKRDPKFTKNINASLQRLRDREIYITNHGHAPPVFKIGQKVKVYDSKRNMHVDGKITHSRFRTQWWYTVQISRDDLIEVDTHNILPNA